MDLLSNLSVVRIQDIDEYAIVLGREESPLRTFGGREIVTSASEQFLEYLINDLWRCSTLNLLQDRSLEFGNVPCAYAIYSDQRELLKNEECAFLSYFTLAILKDRLPIQIANGPPAEGVQIAQLYEARKTVAHLIDEQRYAQLESYNWAQYYADMSGVSAIDDYEGPGIFISDADFSTTEVARYLIDRINQFSDYQKGALIALWHLLNHESILLPFALLSKALSTASFVRTAIYLGSNITLFLDDELLDDPAVVKRDLYAHLETVANIALNYAEAGSVKEAEDIQREIEKGESQTREFKSTFFLNLASRQKDEAISFVILKTIAAFLNSEGGRIYVGVTDDGKSAGIKDEVSLFFKNSEDKYSLAVKEKLKKYFEAYFDLISWEIVHSKNHTRLLIIDVKPSKKPVWILDKGRELFPIRKHPSTETLEGSKQAEYIASHFSVAR